MSAAIQEAVINEALDLSYLFRQNAALKHGLPETSKFRVKLPEEQPKTIVNTVTNTERTVEVKKTSPEPPSPGVGAAENSGKRSLLKLAAPLLITAASGAGGAGLAAWMATKHVPEPAPVQQTVEPKDGSLLQYLQDKGYHLPGGEPWQK